MRISVAELIVMCDEQQQVGDVVAAVVVEVTGIRISRIWCNFVIVSDEKQEVVDIASVVIVGIAGSENHLNIGHIT